MGFEWVGSELENSEVTLVNEIMNSETDKVFDSAWLINKKFDVTIYSLELLEGDEELRDLPLRISKNPIPYMKKKH